MDKKMIAKELTRIAKSITSRIDNLMGQTMYKFVSKIDDDELERLHHTLQMHLSSAEGKNDSNVEALLEVVEFEQIHRD